MHSEPSARAGTRFSGVGQTADTNQSEVVAELTGWCVREGLITGAEQLVFEPLEGGVSSDIWMVATPARKFVFKRPRERLKVSADWLAPVERGAAEVAWLKTVATILPDSVPDVLAHDSEDFGLAMEFLDPEVHSNWKSDLMNGTVDVDFAKMVGGTLVTIHSQTAANSKLKYEFDNARDFEALRIEPYFRRSAIAVPEIAPELTEIIRNLELHQNALIHGDFSPKNILVKRAERGLLPVVLDAECATWSDPAFDLAFCLAHLSLKFVHLPAQRESLLASVDELQLAYKSGLDWEEPGALLQRAERLVAALMLARIVGASPVEYLNPEEAKVVARVAVAALSSRESIFDLLFGQLGKDLKNWSL